MAQERELTAEELATYTDDQPQNLFAGSVGPQVLNMLTELAKQFRPGRGPRSDQTLVPDPNALTDTNLGGGERLQGLQNPFLNPNLIPSLSGAASAQAAPSAPVFPPQSAQASVGGGAAGETVPNVRPVASTFKNPGGPESTAPSVVGELDPVFTKAVAKPEAEDSSTGGKLMKALTSEPFLMATLFGIGALSAKGGGPGAAILSGLGTLGAGFKVQKERHDKEVEQAQTQQAQDTNTARAKVDARKAEWEREDEKFKQAIGKAKLALEGETTRATLELKAAEITSMERSRAVVAALARAKASNGQYSDKAFILAFKAQNDPIFPMDDDALEAMNGPEFVAQYKAWLSRGGVSPTGAAPAGTPQAGTGPKGYATLEEANAAMATGKLDPRKEPFTIGGKLYEP